VSVLLAVVALVAVVFAVSVAACALARVALLRWMVLDTPNARSSHVRPVPRGGGAGFVLVVLAAWTVLWLHGDARITSAVLLGAVAVALVSFADDLGGVSLAKRLIVHAVAIAVALFYLPVEGPILASFLPLPLDRLLAGLAWLWFVNLFNFMDGIDGIAAGEAVVVALGVAVLAVVHPGLGLPALEALTVGAAALGFLLFNWPPARLFMGDVGSTGLGFLLGWLLLITAAKGALVPAFLLPLYFVADATTTLAMRARRRQRLGEAHRDHAYQRGVDGGLSHRAVTSAAIAVGVILIGVSLAAFAAPVAAIGAGLAVTFGFIALLRRKRS
jgi:UDP-N-acetylmuramyl pentapeptide phosphotransferase/UDP-N-acetylglucosamine-1-phosphate transferase